MNRVEIEIQFQHIDVRFAEEAELPSFCVFVNQLSQLVGTYASLHRDSRNLEFCSRWRDVGIKT